MIEYIKFWVAKELLPLGIMVFSLVLIGAFIGLACLYDAIRIRFRRRTPAQSTPEGKP